MKEEKKIVIENLVDAWDFHSLKTLYIYNLQSLNLLECIKGSIGKRLYVVVIKR